MGETGRSAPIALDHPHSLNPTPITAHEQATVNNPGYVGKRVAMTDYPAFRQLGYDCGSGPTESCCGTLTARLKGPGMRWDADNAEAVMALVAIYHSNLWPTYWHAQRQAT